MGKQEAKSAYKHFVPPAKKVVDWHKNFNFVLIESMNDLREAFKNWKPGESFMSFDTETTGLDAEELELVGFSFCLDGKTAYYVPIYHFEYEHNLGEEAVEYFYERMCEAKRVFMFNMKFDARVFEFRGYKDKKEELQDKRWLYVKYDMSKVNYFDVAIPCWLADTNIKMPSLKWCFTGDTLIKTKDGNKKIKDIEDGDAILFDNKVYDILGRHFMGTRDVIELEFSDGYKVKCTSNHKFLVRDDVGVFRWVKAEDLDEECNIVLDKDIEDMKESEKNSLYSFIKFEDNIPYGYIYITENLINHKRYIGQHHCRCREVDKYYKGSGTILKKAIEKYGRDNFKTEVIEWCSSKEELNKREIFWIEHYDAVNSEMFYNVGPGGIGGDLTKFRKPISEETRQKIGKMSRNRKKDSDETRKRKSESHLGERNSRYGKRLGECPTSRKVLCLETGRVFDSLKEAALWVYGEGHSSPISNCAKKNREEVKYTFKGYHWVYVD